MQKANADVRPGPRRVLVRGADQKGDEWTRITIEWFRLRQLLRDVPRLCDKQRQYDAGGPANGESYRGIEICGIGIDLDGIGAGVNRHLRERRRRLHEC